MTTDEGSGDPVADVAARWDYSYRTAGWAPWDIGRPQPAFVSLADAGQLRAPLLDVGCGTGEHALMAAERGIAAMGVDIAPTAIGRARAKAIERGLEVQFEVLNALELGSLGRRFATVIDSGTFHVFSDPLRDRYVTALKAATEPGGVLHLLCFSELTPGEVGPRRVTRREIRDAFADGWRVERIEPERFAVKDDDRLLPDRPHAWLARIVRAEGASPA